MSQPRRLVLGLDPGFASLGFAVVALGDNSGRGSSGDLVLSLGVLRTEKSAKKLRVMAADDNLRRTRELATPMRHLMLHGGSVEIVGGDERRVWMVAAEKMSFPRNASAAAKMAMSWGIIVANLERRDIPLLQATPQEIKKRVAGKKTASKEDVERALCKRFGTGLRRMVASLPHGQHEHAFDALAAIVACLDSEEGRLVRSL